MSQGTLFVHIFIGILACLSVSLVKAEDPYRFFTFEVTYGSVSPIPYHSQRVILINGQFPGPTLESVTNDNVWVNVFNKLDEPFLLTWSGIKQRKVSWQDGVLGTNCPIPPHSNWTYKMQMKDQIGTFTYHPSTLLHKLAGGYGGFNIRARSIIPIPYQIPDGEFTLLISDWWKTDHKDLQKKLDAGDNLPFTDSLLINGLPNSASFEGETGKTYLFRVSNIGSTVSINFRIQGHTLRLVEVEGTHTQQEVYDTFDLHVGQSASFLVTFHGHPKDYFIVASTRFTKPILTATATLHYAGSNTAPAGPLPAGPTYHLHWSMKHARTVRMNLTANAARPNPQGSFHYGAIQVVHTIILANSETKIGGKRRFAVNGISHVDPSTPLKYADYLNIPGVFELNSIKDTPPVNNTPAVLTASVLGTTLHDFVEIIFQNNENTVQSWHLDGNDFWPVAYANGVWNSTLRKRKYNLFDAPCRHTVQVYPYGWTAILVSLDNKGMWNLRSAIWPRRYLGQQLYIRVWNAEKSFFTEYDLPENALFCGKAHP